ncbi:HAMP domain-containing sensor histidine kinase [Neobacillus niacini]|uniref:sensor histidine kinase n=1 Tax=Neobacillus niacini TaxID=86668 RepID=UPI002FFFDF84
MSRTITNFQKFYRTNKEKCSFSVSDSIEEALSIFFSALKNHDIHVDFEYRGMQMAYGIPIEFSQIVLNILTNAREVFDTNNIKDRKLKIQISRKEKFIVVEFTDNAGDIAPGQISKLFEPYSTTSHNGTGIGLYITKMMIENMDGSVHVENTGEGARFRLSVPKVTSKNNESVVSL